MSKSLVSVSSAASDHERSGFSDHKWDDVWLEWTRHMVRYLKKRFPKVEFQLTPLQDVVDEIMQLNKDIEGCFYD